LGKGTWRTAPDYSTGTPYYCVTTRHWIISSRVWLEARTAIDQTSAKPNNPNHMLSLTNDFQTTESFETGVYRVITTCLKPLVATVTSHNKLQLFSRGGTRVIRTTGSLGRVLEESGVWRVRPTKTKSNARRASPTSLSCLNFPSSTYNLVVSYFRVFTTVPKSRYSTRKHMQHNPSCCIDCHSLCAKMTHSISFRIPSFCRPEKVGL
jgi:hypothetical protein